MSRASERLASAMQKAPSGLVGYGQFEVVDLAEDPRDVVVTADGGETSQVMRCVSGYSPRAQGDIVLAHQYRGGWLVIGRIGAPALPPVLSAGDVQELIDASVADVVADFPPVVTVSWSSDPPSGSGWREAVTTYVRDDGDGNRSIHYDLTADAPPPTPKPPVPVKPPAMVTVTANDRGGYLGSTVWDQPMAGDAGSYSSYRGDRVGGWFYGNKIAAACAGKTVSKMVIKVNREDSSHGRNAKVPVRLATHTRTSEGKPSLANKWTTGLSLNRGGSGETTLPTGVRSALASGAAKGIGCWGEGTDDYSKYSAGGQVDIYFSA